VTTARRLLARKLLRLARASSTGRVRLMPVDGLPHRRVKKCRATRWPRLVGGHLHRVVLGLAHSPTRITQGILNSLRAPQTPFSRSGNLSAELAFENTWLFFASGVRTPIGIFRADDCSASWSVFQVVDHRGERGRLALPVGAGDQDHCPGDSRIAFFHGLRGGRPAVSGRTSDEWP